MEKIADPVIAADGSIYSLSGLRRLLEVLTEETDDRKKNNTEKGERLCG